MVSDSDPRALVARAKPAAMLEGLVPTPGCAETFRDVPESTMFSVESAAIGEAAPGRRREYATVRHCARRALRRIGAPAVPILPDADGAPRWPAGVVGSMTHCAGYRGAVVARSDKLRGVGIDAEPHAPLPDPVPELVLRAEERTQLRALAGADSDLHWDRIVFCAKEAVYKAWFPVTRRWLEFDDVSTTLHPDGTFRARLRVRDAHSEAAARNGLAGRWIVDRGLVVAATLVRT
jgi:4'-phosphopantetheinyl transferase EntD